ncbi:hypothetical protein, partial [Alienimonas sp. DA493]|uniref:hypothetical protein n=1 Tax=Alienimonas sp. DA493 TaxID=3373605 RepID=UPI003753E918
GGSVGRAVGWYPLPPELAGTAGLYAVRVDETLAAATLGGTEGDRPRPGDVLIVAADPAVAAAFAATTAGAETPFVETIGADAAPQPPIVLVEGAPRLSLAYRVTLDDAGEPPGKYATRLPAEPLQPAAGVVEPKGPLGRTLEAVGFAVWRGGPWRPR